MNRDGNVGFLNVKLVYKWIETLSMFLVWDITTWLKLKKQLPEMVSFMNDGWILVRPRILSLI